MNENNIKVALVTGASRGIGKAIADMLAREGFNLHLICKSNIDLLKENATAYENKYGISVKCYCGDVSDSKFAQKVFEEIPSIDLLINNAGISYFGLLQDMSDEEWNTIIGCNLSSVFYFCREATKKMVTRHQGKIINISSVWGGCGASLEAAYSATKGGVDSLTKALAKELAPSGISVNAIACGMIDTDMNAHLSDEDIASVVDEIPFCRMGAPSEVAQMVKSIVDAPSYLTGQIIKLDGGWI